MLKASLPRSSACRSGRCSGFFTLRYSLSNSTARRPWSVNCFPEHNWIGTGTGSLSSVIGGLIRPSGRRNDILEIAHHTRRWIELRCGLISAPLCPPFAAGRPAADNPDRVEVRELRSDSSVHSPLVSFGRTNECATAVTVTVELGGAVPANTDTPPGLMHDVEGRSVHVAVFARLKRFCSVAQRCLLNIRLRLRRPRCWDNVKNAGERTHAAAAATGSSASTGTTRLRRNISTPQHKTLYHLEPSAYKVSQCICGRQLSNQGAIRTGENCGVHYSSILPRKLAGNLGSAIGGAATR